MSVLDATLDTAGDIGRAAMSHAVGTAAAAGQGLADAAHHGQAAIDDLGDHMTGPNRSLIPRLALVLAVAALAGLVVWRRRSGESDADSPTTGGTGHPNTAPLPTS